MKKIEIKGFKAFPSNFELKVDGKHMLLYGENGSANPLHLLNRNRLDEDAEIKVTIQEEAWAYTIDKDGCTPELMGGRGRIFHYSAVS